MNNVLQLNAQKVERPNHIQAYRLEVHGVEPGQRLILWQGRDQRLMLEIDNSQRVIFRMEPLGYVS